MIWKKNPAYAWTIGMLTAFLMFAGRALGSDLAEEGLHLLAFFGGGRAGAEAAAFIKFSDYFYGFSFALG